MSFPSNSLPTWSTGFASTATSRRTRSSGSRCPATTRGRRGRRGSAGAAAWSSSRSERIDAVVAATVSYGTNPMTSDNPADPAGAQGRGRDLRMAGCRRSGRRRSRSPTSRADGAWITTSCSRRASASSQCLVPQTSTTARPSRASWSAPTMASAPLASSPMPSST